MITCILVGGNSQRFKDAGYETHKAILPTSKNRVVFQEVFDNLPHKKTVISGRYENEIAHQIYDLTEDYLTHEVWSHSLARGPIYGILDASEYLYVDEPIIVSYCDCWIQGGIGDILEQWQQSKSDSGAILFESDNPRFGYWNGFEAVPWELNRKLLAISGVFYFDNGKKLVDHAFNIAKPGYGLVQLLDVYSKMVKVEVKRVIDVGTPEDYQAYLKSNG